MQAHPRNESNRKAAAQLSAIVESMRNESQAWNKELTRLEDYEAETSRLETLLEQDNTTESGDVIAWDRQDLNETGLQQLRDAEAALDRLLRLEGHEVADTAKPKSRSKGRTSKAAAARNEDEAELTGTEHDTRWADVEFNVSISTSPYLNADTPLCQGHTNTEADQLFAVSHRSISCAHGRINSHNSNPSRAGTSVPFRLMQLKPSATEPRRLARWPARRPPAPREVVAKPLLVRRMEASVSRCFSAGCANRAPSRNLLQIPNRRTLQTKAWPTRAPAWSL